MSYDFKITDLIFSQKNLVPNALCDRLVELYERYPDLHIPEKSFKYNTNEEVFDNYGCFHLNNNFQVDEIKKCAVELFEYVKKILLDYENYIRNSKICPTFSINHIKMTDNMRILKYKKGAFIGPHTDIDKFIRGSLSIQLNDGYEGGDLKFFGQVKRKLQKGEGLIFPAEPIWIHETEPVTEGDRYVMNCFLFNNYLQEPK